MYPNFIHLCINIGGCEQLSPQGQPKLAERVRCLDMDWQNAATNWQLFRSMCRQLTAPDYCTSGEPVSTFLTRNFLFVPKIRSNRFYVCVAPPRNKLQKCPKMSHTTRVHRRRVVDFQLNAKPAQNYTATSAPESGDPKSYIVMPEYEKFFPYFQFAHLRTASSCGLCIYLSCHSFSSHSFLSLPLRNSTAHEAIELISADKTMVAHRVRVVCPL